MTANDATRGRLLVLSGKHAPRSNPATEPTDPRMKSGDTQPTEAAPNDHADPDPENAVDGAQFVLDQPEGIPALWGRGSQVIWPAGEALMIAGGQGLGKTSIALLLVRELLGLGDGVLLGLPVAHLGCRILYLAMDRPKQIARAARRIFAEDDRQVLAEQLVVWSGPPPKDLAAYPALLAKMADHYDAGLIVVDSLKDAAVRLSEDAVGAQWNRARQHLLSQGRQLLELHHTVKRGPQGGPVTGVADIYGSTWLTSGAGSIVLLAGEPGDPIVSFRHVKQPAEEVGPYRVLHDQAAGTLTIDHAVNLVELVKASGVEGLTAKAAAVAITERPNPSRGEIEKARRKLDQLAAAGSLVRIEGTSRHDGGRPAVAWFLAMEQSRGFHENPETAGRAITPEIPFESNHAAITPITRNAKPQIEQSRNQSRQSRR